MAGHAPSHEFRKLRLNTQASHQSQDFPFAASSDADHVASSAFASTSSLAQDKVDRDDQPRRARGSSVSFKEYATLDDGRQHSLDDPLPRPDPPRRRSTRDSCASTDSQTSASAPAAPEDPSPYRINPFTGEPIRRRTKKSEVAPRLETIDSSDAQNLPCLTSASTASLLSDQLKSPDTPSNSGFLSSSAVLSPSPSASPSIGSEPWPMIRPRDKALSRTASLRNVSRRSSRMSGSSMSPASAFLSQWGKDSAPPVVPDPDDEGQPLGLDREYVIGRQIGSGGFSVVKEVLGIGEDGRKTRRAVKIVRKAVANVGESENEKYQQRVEHEIGIWRYLQHDHIMHLHVAYDTDFATFCIMDLVDSGSLFDLIREGRQSGQRGLSATLAKTYAFHLASALRYLHEDVRLVHRDIKLENCLIQQDTQDEGGILKLSDFGLADFIGGDMSESIRSLGSSDSDGFHEPAGTLQYAAPEVLASSGSHLQPSTDIWAFGVCLYTMVTGSLPFSHSLDFRVAELIAAGQWDKDAVKDALAAKDNFDDINDLLSGCLTINADDRWTIGEVMSCQWFSGMQDLSASNEDWQFMNRDS